MRDVASVDCRVLFFVLCGLLCARVWVWLVMSERRLFVCFGSLKYRVEDAKNKRRDLLNTQHWMLRMCGISWR